MSDLGTDAGLVKKRRLRVDLLGVGLYETLMQLSQESQLLRVHSRFEGVC